MAEQFSSAQRFQAQEELIAAANTLSELESSSRFVASSIATDSDYARQLIAYLRHYFGLESDQPIALSDSFDELLLANDIFYRRVSLAKDRASWRSNPILVGGINGDATYILDSTRRAIALVDTSNYSRRIYRSLEELAEHVEPSGYELYPLLPDADTTLKALLSFVFPAVRGDLLKSLALSVLLIVFALISPLITGQVIGDVVPSGDMRWVASVFFIGIILAFYQAAFSYLQSFYSSRIEIQLNLRLEPALYRKVLSLPISFIDKYSTGDLSSRISSITAIVKTIASQCLTTVLSSLSLIGYGGMMLYLDAGLGAPLFVYIFISSIIQVLLVRRQIKFYKKSIPLGAENYDLTLETLSSVAQIRVAASEPFLLQRWYFSLMNVLRLDMQAARLSDWNSAISSILQTLGTVIIYILIVRRLLAAPTLEAASIGLATFVVFTNAYSGFANAFLSLVSLINTVTGSLLVEVDRAMPLLRQPSEATAYFGSNKIVINGAIEFSDVSFSYPGSVGPRLFQDLSFQLKPGKFNVIFGPSGSGKSTIISMILGFALPDQGVISIDGVPLHSIDIRHCRAQIGAVLQQSELTSGSILDAVTGGLDIPVEAVWRTLQMVNIAEEVDRMPMKLQTILSEGSTVISGGQRQRLCIARALLNGPRLLLEDEATSALDAHSQSMIIRNLRDRDITRVVVAHRIATIRDCDHMVVINQGKVEACGSFDECLASSSFLQMATRAL